MDFQPCNTKKLLEAYETIMTSMVSRVVCDKSVEVEGVPIFIIIISLLVILATIMKQINKDKRKMRQSGET